MDSEGSSTRAPKTKKREKKNKRKRAQPEILSQTMVSLGSTFILRGERKTVSIHSFCEEREK
jgi:cell division protein FtsB